MSVANLVAGQTASVQVTGSTAGGKVFVAYSLAGGGPFSSSHGTLLLSPPVEVLNYQIADPLGFAAWNEPVPPGASGVNVWLQAWDKGSLTLSNGLAMTVQ